MTIEHHISRVGGAKPWLASLRIDGKPRSLGRFSTDVAAAVACAEYIRMIQRKAGATVERGLDGLLNAINGVPVLPCVIEQRNREDAQGALMVDGDCDGMG